MIDDDEMRFAFAAFITVSAISDVAIIPLASEDANCLEISSANEF